MRVTASSPNQVSGSTPLILACRCARFPAVPCSGHEKLYTIATAMADEKMKSTKDRMDGATRLFVAAPTLGEIGPFLAAPGSRDKRPWRNAIGGGVREQP